MSELTQRMDDKDWEMAAGARVALHAMGEAGEQVEDLHSPRAEPEQPQPQPAGAHAPVAAENPRNEPGAWDFFLSHAQATGGDQAQNTSLRLKTKGKCVWYDNAMADRSEAAMQEGVENSDNFLLFLSWLLLGGRSWRRLQQWG